VPRRARALGGRDARQRDSFEVPHQLPLLVDLREEQTEAVLDVFHRARLVLLVLAQVHHVLPLRVGDGSFLRDVELLRAAESSKSGVVRVAKDRRHRKKEVNAPAVTMNGRLPSTWA
jgi:hypothetical protein